MFARAEKEGHSNTLRGESHTDKLRHIQVVSTVCHRVRCSRCNVMDSLVFRLLCFETIPENRLVLAALPSMLPALFLNCWEQISASGSSKNLFCLK